VQFTPGSRVGVYEVIGLVAIGGMGEVYRARDTRLGRDVALKILTEAAVGDPERQARFEREARAVAALSHPNIVAIYGFGIENGVAYAAIEWLEGHTLRDELASGPLPVRRVLEIGTQIALGLADAHDKGVIHRDVKPENVFITSEGPVKLLDFGLARIAAGSRASFTQETGSRLMTETGMLLGTFGYMSPEQASGSAADHRSDLFSLGVVLYEMLTGHLAFRRDGPVESLNATLKEGPPPIATLTSGVPFSLEQIVMRCLEKSPAERFQSARDLAFALSRLAAPSSVVLAGGAAPSRPAAKSRWSFVAAVGLATGLFLAVVVFPRHWLAAEARLEPLVTFTIPPPPDTALANVPSRMLAMSPKGDRLVFSVTKGGRRELLIRYLASTKAESLPGTEDASEPFWSPDGQHIGFFADSKLKRISVDGATSMTLCDAPLEARGGTWSAEGQILFADAYGGLSRVGAYGGAPTRVTIPTEEPTHESDSWPQFLPDGHRFLYLRQQGPGIGVGATAYLGTLAGGGARQLVSGVFNAMFIAPDRLLFTDGTGINVQGVDLDRGQMVGQIDKFSADVDRHLGRAALSVSESGTLAYATAGSRDHRLVWVDRDGRQVGAVATVDGWRDIALSPDGARLAVQRIVPEADDIWTIDLARGVPSRFTFSPDVDDDPVWSPDGTAIAFSSIQDGVPGIYEKQLNDPGNGKLLFTNHTAIHPTSWSPDGRFLMFEQASPTSASDIWVLPAQGEHIPHSYLATPFSESDAHFSPDGNWVAYTSDESGRQEVYVQRFPEPRDKLQISTRGGASPRWAPNGHELYFLSAERQLMAVQTTLRNPLQVGSPTRLVETFLGLGASRYAPSHDGKRFLLSIGLADSGAAQIVVVLNWAAHLGT
jgi:serine/threonine protein kinase/Tol biopolymer transport system component